MCLPERSYGGWGRGSWAGASCTVRAPVSSPFHQSFTSSGPPLPKTGHLQHRHDSLDPSIRWDHKPQAMWNPQSLSISSISSAVSLQAHAASISRFLDPSLWSIHTGSEGLGWPASLPWWGVPAWYHPAALSDSLLTRMVSPEPSPRMQACCQFSLSSSGSSSSPRCLTFASLSSLSLFSLFL